ncbi:MAG TPA: recombinase [Chloroflexi bacterium]|nr:recombinase [Chloroflexota bacterium]
MPDFHGFRDYLLARDLAPATVRGYLADLEAFGRWFEQTNGEVLTPAAVTPTDVREYRGWLQRRGLKAATVNRKLSSLREWLQWALASGQIAANPAAGVHKVRMVASGPRWLTKRERYALQRAAEKILQTARGLYSRRWIVHERDALLVLFLLNTGLRVGEVVRLTEADLTLTARAGGVLVRRGKGNKQRVVPLNAEARKAVKRWLETRGETGITAAVLWSVGKGLTARTVQRAVERVAHEAKLDGVTPHVLRHTFAKSLIDAGAGLQEVADLLGHANLQTTRIYVQPSAGDLARAVEALVG